MNLSAKTGCSPPKLPAVPTFIATESADRPSAIPRAG
jgi:hypothetical protein